MRIAWCIPKATNTHSQYVILIAFPRQQWLRERASMLRHTWPTVLVLYRYANTPRLSVKVLAPKTRITVYFRFSQRCSYWLNSWDLQCQLVNSYRRFEGMPSPSGSGNPPWTATLLLHCAIYNIGQMRISNNTRHLPSGVYKSTCPQGRRAVPVSSTHSMGAAVAMYWRNGTANGGGSKLHSPEVLILKAFKLQFVRASQKEGKTQAAYFGR